MTKLKTLKDIYDFRIYNLQKRRLQQCWGVSISEYSDELRQEAIKWIKELNSDRDISLSDDHPFFIQL